MQYLDEAILIAVLIIFLIIYFRRNSKSTRSEKIKAIAAYRRAQTNSLRLQDILSQYILMNECYHEEFRDGKTFGEFLSYLQANHATRLPEANYLRLRNGNSRRFRKKMFLLIENENTKLRELREHLTSIKHAVL